jgi:hypothetical protein
VAFVRCFSWLVPIPAYIKPGLRSWQDPNRFDKSQPRRPLRVFLDQPLTSGSADGEGQFHGYPFTGTGSTGFPPPDAVLRSFVSHSAFEVLFVADSLELTGAVTLGVHAAPSDDDIFPFEVKTMKGVRYTWFAWYREAVAEMAQIVTRHRVMEEDARAGILLHRAGVVLEADLIVTNREWLLAERSSGRLTCVFSPAEAVALMGLYLRWHELPVIIGGAAVRWNPASIRRSAAFTALPAFERWNQAARAWHGATGDLTLENLNQTCLTRVARAFKFRDGVYGLSTTMVEEEPEEMLCELDSLLFHLVGAFDTAARAVDLLLHLGTKPSNCGWQYTDPRQWQSRLEGSAKDLHDYTRDGTEMQRLFAILRQMRNTVHYDALGLVQDDGAYQVTVPQETQEKLRELLNEGHAGWDRDSLGIRVRPPGGATAAKWLPGTGRYSVTVRRSGSPPPADQLEGELFIDVRVFIGKVFPACLAALNEIMSLVPLGQIPGYTLALDDPPREGLPWRYSDTTGYRLRMIFGLTELGSPHHRLPNRRRVMSDFPR